MSKYVVLAISLFISQSAFAELKYSPRSPTLKFVKRVQYQESQSFFSIDGVNGLGISACEEKTGVRFDELPSRVVARSLFVHCLSVSTSTRAALRNVRKFFPLGSQLRGVYVYSYFVGPIKAEGLDSSDQ